MLHATWGAAGLGSQCYAEPPCAQACCCTANMEFLARFPKERQLLSIAITAAVNLEEFTENSY